MTMVKDPMLSRQPGAGTPRGAWMTRLERPSNCGEPRMEFGPRFRPWLWSGPHPGSAGAGPSRSPAIGEGGVVSVFLDGSKVGAISPKQIKVYQVSPGEHSLSLHFLGGLRRSRKLHVPLAEGEEKQFVCLLNAFGWPSIRPATPNDVAAMERLHSAPVTARSLPEATRSNT